MKKDYTAPAVEVVRINGDIMTSIASGGYGESADHGEARFNKVEIFDDLDDEYYN